MAALPQTLIEAVRRRLWLGQFLAAARLALWGTVGLMLLAAAVHLAGRPMSPDLMFLALAFVWSVMAARAAWQRPVDAACALWADRHLGGASAYTTLLELDSPGPGTPPSHAVRHLEAFAAAQVPHSLRLLAERRDALRLSRPLLSALVCAALASLVMMLPGPDPKPQPPANLAATSGLTDRAAPDTDAPVSAELVSEISSALRATAADAAEAPERRGAGDPAASGSDRAGDDGVSASAAPDGLAQLPAPADSGSPAVNPAQAAAAPGASRLAGSGSGQDAGDSRGEPAGVGVARVPRSTIPVQAVELAARRPSGERRADPDQAATYDEELSMRTAASAARRADAAPAAASPPLAAPEMWLSPAETNYVQSWLKASARHR